MIASLSLILLARDRFAILARGPLQGDGVEGASRGLLANLSLLFVPARCYNCGGALYVGA
jgi:putative effector of murein hydrolase LrgA (UPF0299 family)